MVDRRGRDTQLECAHKEMNTFSREILENKKKTKGRLKLEE